MFKKLGIIFSLMVSSVFLSGADFGFGPRWAEANYEELIEKAQLTQSGRSVGEVLRTYDGSRSDRGELQQFLDRFAVMLDDVVAAERPADPSGFAPICDSFPAGSAQPAWAALVRSGSMHISSDGKGRVRLYLPVKNTGGSVDAAATYKAQYSVLRHPLAWLADKNAGKPLSVEVFCFHNDYARRSLRLSLRTHLFTEANFPSGFAQSLNVAELRDFMQVAPKVIGARLSSGSLILVSEKSSPETLAGAPLSIADLAIAYRACVHSGANEPFVSLDPHAEPTKVAVSLGGYLEDTRIGAVLLEADKRFKSLSTGLSPDGIADIAAAVQAKVPTFLTTDERHFAMTGSQSGWRGTRFWFYPDSVVVESNLAGTVAAVVSPRFTADAERSEEDVRKLGAKMEAAKSLLATETRESIAEFNRDYDQLKGSFPELAELDTVGRLMGLCVWSKRSLARQQVDWDALLGVELPAYATPRDKFQLISSSHLVQTGDGATASSRIVRHAYTRQLSARFADLAFTDEEFAGLRDGFSGAPWDVRRDRSGAWSGIDASKPVGQLLSTPELVQNFASIMSKRAGKDPRRAELKASLDEMKAEMASQDAALSSQAERLKVLKAAERYEEYNALVRRYNAAITVRREINGRFNQTVRSYNALPKFIERIVHIGGGISVRPDAFTVRNVPSSPAVARIEDLTAKASPGEGVTLAKAASASGSSRPAVSAVLPPSVVGRAPSEAGKGYYSVSPAGVASEHLVSSDGATVTSVRFDPQGGQAATKLERQPSSDGVTRYKFGRLQGQRFIKPTADEPAR